ncbi:MAG: sugar transferase [Solobacterium sp.]|nr:sugar transferase [Solobacterium sp.]
MYKRNAQGWSKHLDFIIVDIVTLAISFVLAVLIRNGVSGLGNRIYRVLLFVLLLSDMAAIIFFNSMHDVLKRGYVHELSATIKLVLMVFLIATGFMFFTQSGGAYSRLVLGYTAILHLILGYGSRIGLKTYLRRYGDRLSGKRSMLAILKADSAESMVARLNENPAVGYHLVGVVLQDGDAIEVAGVPVVCSLDEVTTYVCREWIDSVYIDCPSEDPEIQKIMRECREMAVPVHYHIPGVSSYRQKQFVERIGGSTVLTLSNNYVTPLQAFSKRLMDLLGGIVGSILAILIIAIVGPMIKAQSPGPILYRSERIGKNGKRFKMIKIRSMVMDAEEQKKDLMDQNRVKDGMMFKLDFDPRIIGNKVLADGTKKTGLGDFIRRTSLDEFPQFFNVLAGDMSLVGTRPPTPDEWEKYEFHHRARLATKPGITGMWQVSGRSEIMDFEEVVKLDTEYIQNWSLGLDIRILLKTVWTVLRGKGAM